MPTICQAKLLFTVCDLPAKAALMNINQFNGYHGCPCCEHKGEQVCSLYCSFRISETYLCHYHNMVVLFQIGHTRVYGYHNNVPCVWRTADEHYHYARKALKDSKVSD